MTGQLLDCSVQEQEWLEGCRRASPKAQENVFRRYYGLVYGTCMRYLSSKEMAQEAMDDCFLKLFYQLESSKSYPAYFCRWLRQLAVRTAIDTYRREKQYLTDRSIDEQTIEVSTSGNVDDTLQAEQLIALLAKLPDLWRLVFNLYEIEGYSHDEIAQLLTIPVSSSRVYLTRAKQRLRELLARETSVRTAMPIYCVPSEGHPEEPDWNYFRDVLQRYEPLPDEDAWQRFKSKQRYRHHTKWWQTGKLTVLVLVGLICEKSQGPVAFLHSSRINRQVTTALPRFTTRLDKGDTKRSTILNSSVQQANTVPERTGNRSEESHRVNPAYGDWSSTSNLLPLYSPEKVASRKNEMNSKGKSATVVDQRLPRPDAMAIPVSEKAAGSAVRATRRNASAQVSKGDVAFMPGSFSRFRQTSSRFIHTDRSTEVSGFYSNAKLPAMGQATSYQPLSAEVDKRSSNRYLPNVSGLLIKPLLPVHLSFRLPVVKSYQPVSMPRSEEVKQSVAIGISAGTQAVYTTMVSPSLGVTGGLWADWPISRKLILETGLTIARPQITQSGNRLITQDSLNRRELLQQTHQWWNGTIPLAVRFRIVETRSLRWWGALGAATSITWGEKQRSDYRVSPLGGNPADSSRQATGFTDQTIQTNSTRLTIQPFGWLTVSTEIRFLPVGKYEWGLEPYVCYPLRATTSEAFRISMAGIRLRLRLRPLNR